VEAAAAAGDYAGVLALFKGHAALPELQQRVWAAALTSQFSWRGFLGQVLKSRLRRACAAGDAAAVAQLERLACFGESVFRVTEVSSSSSNSQLSCH
jgi:hypothetical protein